MWSLEPAGMAVYIWSVMDWQESKGEDLLPRPFSLIVLTKALF